MTDLTRKDRYRKLCESEASIPIFSQHWWLDAVCGPERWDVLLVEKNDSIVASLPLYKKKMFSLNFFMQPLLTQTNGAWIQYPAAQKPYARITYEKEVLTQLIDQLNAEKPFVFDQYFHYHFKNWLPFYWKGFKQSTRYTYVIDDISDPEKVLANFEHAKRKNIKKAQQIVSVKYDLDAKTFYENHKLTLAKQGERISYSFEVFEALYKSAYAKNSGRVIYAVDAANNIHGALFVVWDQMSAYDLVSTIDPTHRNSGAASLLVYEIIKTLSGKGIKFDFEGSMIENVENSFRQFGAEQKQYFHIYREPLLITAVKAFLLSHPRLLKWIRKVFLG